MRDGGEDASLEAVEVVFVGMMVYDRMQVAERRTTFAVRKTVKGKDGSVERQVETSTSVVGPVDMYGT